MSIPLDRLYNFIEQNAQEIHGGRVIIYRFSPHGEKNINNLLQLSPITNLEWMTSPEIICNDQEPLMFEMYENHNKEFNNLRVDHYTIWDSGMLLHSEKNSPEVDKYIKSGFIPVYYWSHALIALDWFRYAKYTTLPTADIKNDFLIYNRAWSGTREYRLKFADLLIENDLVKHCNVRHNPIDPTTNCHYNDHAFVNNNMKPIHILENHIDLNTSDSWCSADFSDQDYATINIEVVLETLFDDSRIQLTEKILRPIALGIPFILSSTPKSLQYLRDYGFKTFNTLWDESYDDIIDPVDRLNAIISIMNNISSMDPESKFKLITEAKEIAAFNKCHFFSEDFTNTIICELKNNIGVGLQMVKSTNTGTRWYKRIRRLFAQGDVEYNNYRNNFTRKELSNLIKLSRSFNQDS